MKKILALAVAAMFAVAVSAQTSAPAQTTPAPAKEKMAPAAKSAKMGNKGDAKPSATPKKKGMHKKGTAAPKKDATPAQK